MKRTIILILLTALLGVSSNVMAGVWVNGTTTCYGQSCYSNYNLSDPSSSRPNAIVVPNNPYNDYGYYIGENFGRGVVQGYQQQNDINVLMKIYEQNQQHERQRQEKENVSKESLLSCLSKMGIPQEELKDMDVEKLAKICVEKYSK